MSRPDDLLLAHAAVDAETPIEAVQDAAWAFVAAGGALSLSEYRGLADESRAAMRAAQKRLWEERAATVVLSVANALDGLRGAISDEAAQTVADRIADEAIGAIR